MYSGTTRDKTVSCELFRFADDSYLSHIGQWFPSVGVYAHSGDSLLFVCASNRGSVIVFVFWLTKLAHFLAV